MNSIKAKATLAWAILSLFWTAGSSALAQGEYPASVLKYLSYLDQLKTVEYDVETSLGPVGTTPVRATVGRLVYFFDSGNSYFRSNPDLDKQGNYEEVFQENVRFRFNVDAKQGQVTREKQYWPLQPINLMGLQISHCVGDFSGIGIPELIERKMYEGDISEFGDAGFVLKNIYGRPGSPTAIDLFVVLDAGHQYCPLKFSIVARKPSEEVSPDGGFDGTPKNRRWLFKVEEFASDGGFDVPTKVSCYGQGLLSEATSILIGVNSKASVPETYRFPEDSFWVDNRDGSKHGNEKIVDEWTTRQQNKAGSISIEAPIPPRGAATYKNAPWISPFPWFMIVLFAGIVFLLFALFARKKYLHVMLICFVSSSLCTVGCNKRSDAIGRLDQHLVKMDGISELRFGLSERVLSNRLKIGFVNKSNKTIVLPEAITTSCGCSKAEWSKKSVGAGESVDLIVIVNRPQVDSPRQVYLTSEITDIDGHRLQAIDTPVNIVTDEEWVIREKTLLVSHELGERGRGNVTVQSRTSEPISFVCEGAECELVSVRKLGESNALYELVFECGLCRELKQDTRIGEIVIRSPGNTPEQTSLIVESRVNLPYKLSRRVLVPPQKGSVSLKLNDGWALTQVSSTSHKIFVSVVDEINEKEIQVRNLEQGNFQCSVICEIRKGNTKTELQIPVISTAN